LYCQVIWRELYWIGAGAVYRSGRISGMFSQRSCRVAAPHDNRSAAAIHVDAQRSAISQD